MSDQPMNIPRGAKNPRNNPRQHQKPHRRRSDAGATGAVPATPMPSDQGAAAPAPRPRGRHASVPVPDTSPTGSHVAAPSASQTGPRPAAAPSASQTGPRPAAPAASQTGPHAPHGSRYQQQGGYAGYAQGTSSARSMPAQKVEAQLTPYADFDRYKKKSSKKKVGIISLVVIALVLVGAGVGMYLYLNPPTFNVTVNGMTRTVSQGSTVADMVSEGIVSPKPGNLVAVDGEVIEEGGGTAFSGTINGSEISDPAAKLHKNDTVQVSDGADVMEDYDVEVIETEPGRAELGEGAIHVYVPGVAGKTEKRTGKVSGKTAEEVVQEGQDNIYLQYNANPGDEKVVALTFDDGPWGTTSELLDLLKEYGVTATFFTIGEQIADQPNTMQQMIEAGHQICTHTWDHAAGSGRGVDLTRMSAEEQVAEVTQGQQAIADVTGTEASKVIRAPGGNYHGDIVWTLQPYATAEIGWNVDTEDWRTPGVDAIAERIMSAKSGDIVLMHDGGGPRTQTIEALKIALPYLKEQGFKFVTIDELLAYDDAQAIARSLQEGAEG